MARLARGDVKAIHWDDGSHRVDVWRGPEPDRTVWVRIGTSPSLVAPDAGARARAPADAGPPPGPTPACARVATGACPT